MFLTMGRACLGKGFIDRNIAGHVDLAEQTSDFRGKAFTQFGIKIEQRNLGTFFRKGAGSGGAKS